MTLAQLVDLWRRTLDDTKTPYGWSDDFLTGATVSAINDLCRKAMIIEDATTASICTLSLLAGAAVVSISDRVTAVVRAKLSSLNTPLERVESVEQMDLLHPGWDGEDASTPSTIIIKGSGTSKVRLWPATLLADTLNLTVFRLPLTDLSWATDQATVPEIPSIYHRDLLDGVLALAYQKDDPDTFDPVKAELHRKKWKDKIEEIKRAEISRREIPTSAAASQGWL